MSTNKPKLIKKFAEFIPKEQRKKVPADARGIYALLKKRPKFNAYDVVYIGMASRLTNGGISRRLRRHEQDEEMDKEWTHFSIFEVWENVSGDEIRELEGILLRIYQKDSRANRLVKKTTSGKLKYVKDDCLDNWKK